MENMDERTSIERSRSSYLDAESLGNSTNDYEEFEMQNSVNSENLNVNDVLELLQQQYAIISGGKSKEGCPIITFPDNNNFETLSDIEYQRLMMYLTSVPSLHDADLGFHLIIDRRNDKWNSVKTVLLKISVYFPGLIHVVYVLRPASFLQKALSEVSNKLFKDEFKFRMIVLSTTEELHKYINSRQLTPDLGGTLNYNNENWIHQRMELETFSAVTQQVSNSLDNFTKTIEETELPNDVEATQKLLDNHSLIYSDLKKDILSAAKHGEDLLTSIKEKNIYTSCEDDYFPLSDTCSNVFAIERLLVQLEETERTFDEFWQGHFVRLRNCLELRRFEQDFRELQINFETNLKIVGDMVENGDSTEKVDKLLKQAKSFNKLCSDDIDRAEEVIQSGYHLIAINSCPIECVKPKCTELSRVRNLLIERLSKRIDNLVLTKLFIERVENANKWCANGVELLATQKIEQCASSVELAEKYLKEIKEFLASSKEFTSNSPKDFKDIFQESTTSETRALISQIVQRIEDVTMMCNKRVVTLNKLAVRPQRPVQTVNPEPMVPRQPGAPAPHHYRAVLKKAFTMPKMSSPESVVETSTFTDNSPTNSDEINKFKTKHVLNELFETEKMYVHELSTIIKGYKDTAQFADMQPLLPPDAQDKLKIIFGNLDEILKFHSEQFLKDLENCITSRELVALCFLQRREMFSQLYSFYCLNISKSEQVRESSPDLLPFFQACQEQLGHKLPLAAYLLKPVQRITKYQLLLKDLLKYSNEDNNCIELQQALDCMLCVLKGVNDSMHQISITGFSLDLSQQGELLLQGSFSVWIENKRLRLKPMQRHLFLYQKALLFCKPISKAVHNNATYQFKHYLQMSKIGLTESVKGDTKKFEVWLQGRQEVYTIQAPNLEVKQSWVNEIKKVLFNQLEEIKGEKIRQYAALVHKPLTQTTSWEKQKNTAAVAPMLNHQRAMSCDSDHPTHMEEMTNEIDSNWSSDYSNSDDEDNNSTNARYVALADYCAVGNSEVNIKEGDIVELLKVGCAGWWFVRMIGTNNEGWAPAAYLENSHFKNNRSSSSRSQDKLNF
ncbi:guanine nucleotide exchange factor DBS-like isoform X1 [Diorhabda sublineata]|uniref:guanine nucleotide exchange factor DBS-like isoform X1 n=1 Tax=Diorhabda sublineata TaxID=1163346 RepID=UPI0024E18A5D|nr:guanine nucleotide exchange factor DBS-like isoform X1 [Diorhabda sublineata]